MAELFALEPEVSGGLGESCIMEYELGRSSIIHHLDYEFQGWLGDELLTTSPTFIVTVEIEHAIKSASLTGAFFRGVTISKSWQFNEFYGEDYTLPNFVQLMPLGVVGLDNDGAVSSWTGEDFNLINNNRLVVTSKGLALLKSFRIKHCTVNSLTVRLG